MQYFSNKTLVQIATPPGNALVGALRVSGEDALSLVGSLLVPERTALEPARRCFDALMRVGVRHAGAPCPVRVFVMPAPHSYTREHVVEIHAAGSPIVLRAIMEACIAAGARAAGAGEFTFRAFRSGRLSLAQAEAVEELVRAENQAGRKRALSRLGGHDASRLCAWRDRMMDLAAHIEASLDFSDENVEIDAAVAAIAGIADELEREGIAVRETKRAGEHGLVRVALVGMANAGKSSLLNAMLGVETALVSDIPSTTRDSLRRQVSYNGMPFILSDNPGYHPDGEGGGLAAAEGAFDRLGEEDIACWVMDASARPGKREAAFAGRLSGRVVLVLNKTDVAAARSIDEAAAFVRACGVALVDTLEVSAKTGRGVDELFRRIGALADSTEPLSLWNARESAELSEALFHSRAAASELNGAGRIELAADDMRLAVESFGRALGEGYAEEALARIFSRFCIGK